MKRQVRLLADYGSFPTWIPGEDVYNIDPAGLPISNDLVSSLSSWAREYDSTLNMDDPVSSGFSTDVETQRFVERGLDLAKRLKRELGQQWTVVFFDESQQRDIEVG